MPADFSQARDDLRGAATAVPEAMSARFAPPDCGICDRTMLVGESVRGFRRDDGEEITVCALCSEQAARSGFEPVGAAHTLRVRAAGSVRHAVTIAAAPVPGGVHIAPIDEDPTGDSETESVDGDTAPREAAGLAAPPRRADGRDAELMDVIHRQERELQQLRADSGSARRLEDAHTIERLNAQLQELRERLRGKDEQIRRLDYARVAETRPREMKRAALEAFNISEDLQRMRRIARTLGEPEVRVTDQGPGIPRRVELLFVWDIAWYEYCVKLDLGRGQASVHELGQGGDPTEHGYHRIRANATWRDSGVLLD